MFCATADYLVWQQSDVSNCTQPIRDLENKSSLTLTSKAFLNRLYIWGGGQLSSPAKSF